MNALLSMKKVCNDLEVEYDVIAPVDMKKGIDERQLKIIEGLQSVDAQLEVNQKKIDEINVEIDRLTNHADGIDYMVAVASGLIAGLVDAFFVGEFNVNWGSDKVNEFIIENAKKQKNVSEEFENNSENDEKEILRKAIKFFEDKYKLPGDNIHQTKGLGISADSHHLDDLAHHPSLLGLLCSIIMQFTKKGMYQNKKGKTKIIIVEGQAIGQDVPNKLFCGIVNWFWHLVSDVGGSKDTPGAGRGIPGPIMSVAKEIAMIPGINKTPLPKLLDKLFVEEGLDFRCEITVAHELGKQAIPVLINEVTVRSFYFIRRTFAEYKEKGNFIDIEWKNTLPFKNRTITRMLTIATGTFTAVDMADAAIRAAVKSGGVGPTFASNFVLCVNFVGVGRFAVACASDIKMGGDRNKLRDERMGIYNEQILLSTAKVFYKHADMWIAAESAGRTIQEAYDMMDRTGEYFSASLSEIRDNMDKIGEYLPDVEKNNAGLLDEIDDILTWG